MVGGRFPLVAIQLVLMLAGAAAGKQTQAASRHTPIFAIDDRRMPATAKGANFYACQKHVAKILDTYNTTVRLPDDTTIQPLHTHMSPALADAAAAVLTDAEIEAYCQAVYDPLLEQAIAQAKTGQSRKAEAAAKQQPRAKPSDFTTPFLTDPVTGLYLPHDAEYSLTSASNSYSVIMNSLPAGVYTDTSGRSRSNLEPVSANTITCVAFEKTGFIISTICAATGTVGTWEGVDVVATGGSWQAPAEIACLIALTIDQAGYEGCKTVTDYSSFIDGLVDSAEIQGAYENAKKALNNQVTLWQKMDADTKEIEALINRNTQLILNLIADVAKKVDDAVETLATQNCDVKNQIADVQREVNYLRYLAVTPDGRRPQLAASTAECSVSAPEYCTRASTAKPSRPFEFTEPAACRVSDGVRRFELGEEGDIASL